LELTDGEDILPKELQVGRMLSADVPFKEYNFGLSSFTHHDMQFRRLGIVGDQHSDRVLSQHWGATWSGGMYLLCGRNILIIQVEQAVSGAGYLSLVFVLVFFALVLVNYSLDSW
jgi:hypothetical protein